MTHFMQPLNSKQVGFKVSSRTARMMGRQNVSNQYVAIVELIKNAYDADSRSANIIFSNAEEEGGTIIIQDYGVGMDNETLENHWLTLGTDHKEREPISDGGRIRTGAKGIGRFALDRLGALGVVETFQKDSTTGYKLIIDWDKYDLNLSDFEKVTHELQEIPNTDNKVGTTLTISKLRDQWTTEDYETLSNDLALLIPPIEHYNTNFTINLTIDSEPDLSGPVKPLAREVAEFELNSVVDSEGIVTHSLLQIATGEEVSTTLQWADIVKAQRAALASKRRKGKKNIPKTGSLFDGQPSFGPATFQLLFFLRAGGESKGLDFKLTALRNYLNTFSGVRIYRDGFQVKPYGSNGNDWLGLNSRKARSPEGVGQELGRYRVSSNQLVGTVTVSRMVNIALEDKANREGIIETAAYHDLKAYLLDAIQFLELTRQELELEQKRQDFQPDDTDFDFTIKDLKTAFDDLSKNAADNANSIGEKDDVKNSPNDISVPTHTSDALEQETVTVPKSALSKVQEKINEVQAKYGAQLEENQLLRALATTGIALSTFSHEIQSSVAGIDNQINIARLLVDETSDEKRKELTECLKVALEHSDRVQQWSTYVLESIQSQNRQIQQIDFEALLARIVSIFTPSFNYRHIRYEQHIADEIPPFYAFPIDIESILINLITNSVKALEAGIPLSDRLIRVGTKYLNECGILEISFEDSAHGIDIEKLPKPKRSIEQIFDPFVTASGSTSTGMGLAVVHKIVYGLKGKISVIAKGSLGGAHFKTTIPLKLVL